MSVYTSEEQTQKSKRPLAAVSISPRRMRSLSGAVGCRKWLHLWNHGIWSGRLAEAGGFIIIGLDLSAVDRTKGASCSVYGGGGGEKGKLGTKLGRR